MSDILHTLLVLALPASGKSEVRRRMEELGDPGKFHMSDTTVQLDDFPYVHLMRRIDEKLVELGLERAYFQAEDQPFIDPRCWEVLVHLVNQDYADLLDSFRPDPIHGAAGYLLDRLDHARVTCAGMASMFNNIEESGIRRLLAALKDDCDAMLRRQQALFDVNLDEATIVIEFARGGSQDANLPLPPPHGNQNALSLLSCEILKHAAILWVQVTPEESRRKNLARAIPGEEDSILHHCVPEAVMREDYGTCDIRYLLEHSEGGPDTVTIGTRGHTHVLPIGTFHNMPDLTTCMHAEPDDRDLEAVAALDTELEQATGTIWRTLGQLEEAGYYE